MQPLLSRVDTRAEAFAANRDANLDSLAKVAEKLAKAHAGGGEKYVARHVARGKLLPRERVRALLDPGSPFLEIGQLAAYGMYGGDVPSASIVTGVGRVSGHDKMLQPCSTAKS